VKDRNLGEPGFIGEFVEDGDLRLTGGAPRRPDAEDYFLATLLSRGDGLHVIGHPFEGMAGNRSRHHAKERSDDQKRLQQTRIHRPRRPEYLTAR
jgi:hypothetical protein